MKYYWTLAALLLFTCLVSCREEETERPNIILIVADDLGWKDVGFMGSDYYETPHLDQLASEGMVFQQAYAPAANCAPSRACLMTGKYTPAHGVYTVSPSARGDTRTRRIIPVVNRDSLDPDFHTLAEALQESGYTTCNIGKWHLGKDPRIQGMDVNVGGSIWGHPKSYFAPYVKPNLEAPDGEYLTDRLTTEAQHFIRQHSDSPFFLYLPYYAVHTPIQPKYELKADTGCQSHAGYAGMVDNLDRCIGILMEEIRSLDLEEKTLIIFTSDNGGIRKISCQDPLRAGKGSYYEGGIRVPMVVRWPGHIEAGRVSDVPVIHIDFYPTLMEIIDRNREEVELDGISLWPLLTGREAAPERPLYFHFPIYLQAYETGYDQGRDPLFRTRPGSVIREGDWKLHYYYEDGGTELYDLSIDPGERVNLVDINSSKREELLDKLNAWLEQQHVNLEFDRNPEFDAEYEQQLLEKYR